MRNAVFLYFFFLLPPLGTYITWWNFQSSLRIRLFKLNGIGNQLSRRWNKAERKKDAIRYEGNNQRL